MNNFLSYSSNYPALSENFCLLRGCSRVPWWLTGNADAPRLLFLLSGSLTPFAGGMCTTSETAQCGSRIDCTRGLRVRAGASSTDDTAGGVGCCSGTAGPPGCAGRGCDPLPSPIPPRDVGHGQCSRTTPT